MLEAKAFLRGTSTGRAGGFPTQQKRRLDLQRDPSAFASVRGILVSYKAAPQGVRCIIEKDFYRVS